MRTRFKWVAWGLGVVGAALCGPATAYTVFACEPEWAALTRSLLPEARLFVATHAGQDPHHIEARPALIAQLRSADLAVCTGAGLEAGWLPVLQQRAGKARPQDLLFAADQVVLKDPRPGAIGSPWAGDVHAEGNPHIHGDPRNLLPVARALAQRLQQDLPAQQAAIAQRLAGFEARLNQHIAQWQGRAAPLRGRTVAAQHSTFGYLWAWLGLRQVADLEPKPGMAPTPGHLQQLLNTLKPQPPLAVVVASYQDPRPGRWLSAQLAALPRAPAGTGLPTPMTGPAATPSAGPAGAPPAGPGALLVWPATVAEDADGEALLRWYDGLLTSLLASLNNAAGPAAAAGATPNSGALR